MHLLVIMHGCRVTVSSIESANFSLVSVLSPPKRIELFHLVPAKSSGDKTNQGRILGGFGGRGPSGLRKGRQKKKKKERERKRGGEKKEEKKGEERKRKERDDKNKKGKKKE